MESSLRTTWRAKWIEIAGTAVWAVLALSLQSSRGSASGPLVLVGHGREATSIAYFSTTLFAVAAAAFILFGPSKLTALGTVLLWPCWIVWGAFVRNLADW
jgi:hypothetical protein